MRRRTLILLAGGVCSVTAIVGLHSSAVVSAGTWSTVNQFSTIGPWSPVAQIAQAPVPLESELAIASREAVAPPPPAATSATLPASSATDLPAVPLPADAANLPTATSASGVTHSSFTMIVGRTYLVSTSSAGAQMTFATSASGLLDCRLGAPGVGWSRLLSWPLLSGTPDMAHPAVISCSGATR